MSLIAVDVALLVASPLVAFLVVCLGGDEDDLGGIFDEDDDVELEDVSNI